MVTARNVVRGVDGQPQKMDLAQARMLANMAELMARSMESNWILEQSQNVPQKLRRSVECYSVGFIVLDLQSAGWSVLHMNNAAWKTLGLRWNGQPISLGQLFHLSKEHCKVLHKQASARDDGTQQFALLKLQQRDSDKANHSISFDLFFKSAEDDILDDDTVVLALPANCASIQCHTVQKDAPSVRYMIAAVYPAGTHVEKERSSRKRLLHAHQLHVAATVSGQSVGSCGEQAGPLDSPADIWRYLLSEACRVGQRGWFDS
eukprot:jgi/Botrbrau1/18255/Bobra.0894s0001.1